MTKEMFYRLEFKQSSQKFHLEYLDKSNVADENTKGWATICSRVSETEQRIFFAYLDSLKKERYSVKELREYVNILSRFIIKLADYNLEFSPCGLLK